MTNTPSIHGAQVVRPDASNPHLVACLHLTLGEWGWDLTRLANAMRWHRKPEWLAGVSELARELSLITTTTKPKAKAKPKSQRSPEPDEEQLNLPVALLSAPPQSPKVIQLPKPRTGRGPATWDCDDEH